MPIGDREYAPLAVALRHTTPACAGDDRFTADALTPLDEVLMRGLCRECPLNALCAAYAHTARPTAGFWAGKNYAAKTRGERR